ncbi:hypothetical protein AX15_000974, partial [Amanita polypyramis BW_CC]
YFRDQPLLHASVTDQHLVAWYFEDWLKKYFFSILQILEILSLDPLSYIRTQVISLIFTLLRDKPEQEQNLLRLLVNKLGDTERSICSRASYHLLQLLQTHPAMKSVVIREVISLVLKPPALSAASSEGLPKGKHIRFTDDTEPTKPKAVPAKKINGSAHARYYSIITLNQVVLTPSDRDVARQLLDVYFEVFREVLGEGRDDVDDNKTETEETEKSVKIDKVGRVFDGGWKRKKKGKKSSTEVAGAAGFAEVEDENAKLITATLTGVNRALPFAKVDTAHANINKHIDTLFLITHKSTFNISLQALVLIQQISSSVEFSSSSSLTSKAIKNRYYRALYASLHDTRLSNSSKQAMYLNLLFKSIKADAGNVDRVMALVRRFIQVLVSGGSGATEFVVGGLYLLGELFSSVPGLRSTISQTSKSDDESYDPRKRDPQFAHAQSSPLWELTVLLRHYHPAVSLHARQLLISQPVTSNPELTENTLSHFLDRFVYKNPKKVGAGEGGAKTKGASAMQPAATGLDGLGVKIMKTEVDGASMRINEAEFLGKKESDIPVDQVFFHRYFAKKKERVQAKAAKTRKKGESVEESEMDGGESKEDVEGSEDEEDEGGSELDEEEVWKASVCHTMLECKFDQFLQAMRTAMPKATGDDDDLLEDSDELPSDFDMSEDEGGEGEAQGSKASDFSEDNDVFALMEASDNDDLVSLEAEVPEGLIKQGGTDSDDEEWGGIEGEGAGKKRRRKEERKDKRKKLRSLPTFASYEEYAKMIEEGGD